MVRDCGALVAKFCLLLTNLALFTLSSALLLLGAWLAVDKRSFVTLTKLGHLSDPGSNADPDVVEQLAYMWVAAAIFVVVVAFLGYCGALKECRVLLTSYGLFLLILAAFQTSAIIMICLNRDKAELETKNFLMHTLSKYYSTQERRDAVTLLWDLAMAKMECCGVQSSDDFKLAREFVKYTRIQGLGQIVPEACCRLDENAPIDALVPLDDDCILAPSTFNSYMSRGCLSTLRDWMTRHMDVALLVSVSAIGCQLFLVLFAFCLCKAVSRDRDYRDKYNRIDRRERKMLRE